MSSSELLVRAHVRGCEVKLLAFLDAHPYWLAWATLFTFLLLNDLIAKIGRRPR